MIHYFDTLIQGSDEWKAARCGLLTASEMKLILTPGTLKIASNEKERKHIYELLAQRITRYVEPSYIGDDMLRGFDDEILARELYEEHYAPVKEMGFITNDKWGFTIGYSPDGLVGDAGLIESKSRRQGLQMETIVENLLEGSLPQEHTLQVQTGLVVSEREWCDYLSFCGGLHMVAIRVYPIEPVQEAIINAAGEFERRLAKKMERYADVLASNARVLTTERRANEMYV